MLGNQHCALQPTLCLSLYLATNIWPLIILGNPTNMLGNQHCASNYTWQPSLCLSQYQNCAYYYAWLPTLWLSFYLATNIVHLIILGNQHCTPHNTWQPILCLSLYLATNIVPFNMLGNPCWTLALCIPLVSPISFSEIQLLYKTMKSLRMVTNGNINEFYFTVTHNWKTRTTPHPQPTLFTPF